MTTKATTIATAAMEQMWELSECDSDGLWDIASRAVASICSTGERAWLVMDDSLRIETAGTIETQWADEWEERITELRDGLDETAIEIRKTTMAAVMAALHDYFYGGADTNAAPAPAKEASRETNALEAMVFTVPENGETLVVVAPSVHEAIEEGEQVMKDAGYDRADYEMERATMVSVAR